MDAYAALPVALAIAWTYRALCRRHPVWAPRVGRTLIASAVAWVGLSLLRPAPDTDARVWLRDAPVDRVFVLGDRHVVRLGVREPGVCLGGEAAGLQALAISGLPVAELRPGQRVDALIRIAPWGCGLLRVASR